MTAHLQVSEAPVDAMRQLSPEAIAHGLSDHGLLFIVGVLVFWLSIITGTLWMTARSRLKDRERLYTALELRHAECLARLDRMHERIRGSNLVKLEVAVHNICDQYPDQCADALLQFLVRV